ncbi:MAG: outer membrane beta-barrel protein [Hyphomicrobiales bacterium]|nr:outer membrane beta-barrel protein [Hyphomicrobiales bacterium]
MGSLKSLAVAGAVMMATASYATAGDLPAPPPPGPGFDAPLRGTVSSAGLYLRGDIGVGAYSRPNMSILSNGAPLVVAAPGSFAILDRSLGSAAFGGVGIGYAFNNWFRLDLTGEYRADARFGAMDETVFANGAAVPTGFVNQRNGYNGSVSSSVFLANAYVDLGTFCQLGCITPFLGAGIGFANNTFSSVNDTSTQFVFDPATNTFGAPFGATQSFFASKSKVDLAWAVMAGLSYDVSRNVKLEVGYRYLNMGKVETGGLVGQPADTIRLRDLASHDFRLGMRWMLNGGDCCGSPAPVFAPAPMVRKF